MELPEKRRKFSYNASRLYFSFVTSQDRVIFVNEKIYYFGSTDSSKAATQLLKASH